MNNSIVSTPQGSAEYVSEGYAGLSEVHSIVTIMSDVFASAPMVVNQFKNKKDFERYKLLTKSYHPSSLTEIQRLRAKSVQEVDNHPLLDLLNKSGFDFRSNLNAFRDVTGNAYLWLNRGLSNSEPSSIQLLPSQYMSIKQGSTPWEVEGYQLSVGVATNFSKDEVAHWKYPTLNWGRVGEQHYGMSPLQAAAYDMAAAREGKKSAANTFMNRGAGGFFTRDEDIVWSTEQRDALMNWFDENVNGNNNKSKAVPVNVRGKWVQMAMSAGDMELIESLKLTKENLANVFNFPVHLLSAASGTFNNVDAANKYLVTKTVYPKWQSFRDFVNNSLMHLYKGSEGMMFDHDISAFPELQDDIKLMHESLKDAYWLTPEEKRMMGNWEDSGDQNMKKYYFPSSLVPLDQLNETEEGLDRDIDRLRQDEANDYE